MICIPVPLRPILVIILFSGLLGILGEAAADQPPDELLDAIFPVLRGKSPAPPLLQNTFLPGPPTSPACGLRRLDLVQTKGAEKRVFHLLADPKLGENNQPKTMLIRLNTIGVDADGSRRAYHPDDPFGNRCKSPADDPASQICAVDGLGNAEIRVYEHNKRVPQYASGPNPAFVTAWTSLWAEIAARKNNWVDLEPYFGANKPKDTRLYYSKELDRAVTFNTEIIPFKEGFPCQHGDKRNEYFIAATTKRDPPPASRDACRTAEHLDAMKIPFFVLPPAFSDIKIGDIAIGFASIGGAERFAFGAYGDQGPPRQIGEASVAFVQRLRGSNDTIIIINNRQAVALQLEAGSGPAQQAQLGVLVFGGTAAMLGSDYSAENIERVAREVFAHWTSRHAGRLQACLSGATPNPLKGSPAPAQ